MSTSKVKILGTGSYAPAKVLTNDDLAKMVETSDEWITQRSGIKERHIATDDQTPSVLGTFAAQKALERAGVKAQDIDLVVVGTSYPDHLFPTTACLIQNKLGCTNAGAYDVLAACSGFVYAFSTACQFVRSGAYKNVLAIGAETLSKITNWQDRTTCVLFGDAAGAAVVGRSLDGDSSDVLYVELGADGSRGPLIMLPAGGAAMPTTRETIEQKQHFLQMKGREVYEFAIRKFVEIMQRALQNANLKVADVALLIPHQMNIRIIESVSERIGFPREKVFVNIHKYGNTSSASIPVALNEAIESGRIRRGDVVILAALGGGLTWGTVVFRY